MFREVSVGFVFCNFSGQNALSMEEFPKGMFELQSYKVTKNQKVTEHNELQSYKVTKKKVLNYASKFHKKQQRIQNLN